MKADKAKRYNELTKRIGKPNVRQKVAIRLEENARTDGRKGRQADRCSESSGKGQRVTGWRRKGREQQESTLTQWRTGGRKRTGWQMARWQWLFSWSWAL